MNAKPLVTLRKQLAKPPRGWPQSSRTKSLPECWKNHVKKRRQTVPKKIISETLFEPPIRVGDEPELVD